MIRGSNCDTFEDNWNLIIQSDDIIFVNSLKIYLIVIMVGYVIGDFSLKIPM